MKGEAAHTPGVLGAILTGGESRRFGRPKARALLAGVPLAARVRDLLAPVTSAVVLVGGDPSLGEALGLDVRPDGRPGAGPVAGLEAALAHARASGHSGVFVLACDMPLVPPGLLRTLVAAWDGARALLPESPGPLGVEPLCGLYPVAAAGPVTRVLDGPDRSMVALVQALDPARLERARVARHGDPRTMFLNINRPEDLERAEAALRSRESDARAS